MRLNEIKTQWVAYENAYNSALSNNGYYYYPNFQTKELVRQGQILHAKVFPPMVYSNSNWSLPEPTS